MPLGFAMPTDIGLNEIIASINVVINLFDGDSIYRIINSRSHSLEYYYVSSWIFV